MTTSDPAPLHAPRVTTTDLLKVAALGLILIDHIGHYLLPDWPVLRVIGRLGAPIFFFLIGFAKTRTIPYRWLVLGVVLTGVDYLWTGDIGMTLLNILFNFALIRIALPLVERNMIDAWWRLGALLALCLIAIPFVGEVLEYGAQGWLFALAGLLHRRVLDESEAWRLRRDIAGLVALGASVVTERHDYDFDLGMTALLVVLMAVLAVGMREFRRGDLARQPGEKAGALMRFCGRYSLEIYAAQIILLASVGAVWNQIDPTDTDDDDDE